VDKVSAATQPQSWELDANLTDLAGRLREGGLEHEPVQRRATNWWPRRALGEPPARGGSRLHRKAPTEATPSDLRGQVGEGGASRMSGDEGATTLRLGSLAPTGLAL